MTGRKPVEELEHKLKWGMRGLRSSFAQKFAPDDDRMWQFMNGWLNTIYP